VIASGHVLGAAGPGPHDGCGDQSLSSTPLLPSEASLNIVSSPSLMRIRMDLASPK